MDARNRAAELLDGALEVSKGELTDEIKQEFDDATTEDEIREGLDSFLEKSKLYKGRMEICDANIKNWQGKKSILKKKQEALTEYLRHVLERFKIRSLTSPRGVKAFLSSGQTLETDDELLTKPYRESLEKFQNGLPPYLTASLSVDKRKLKSFFTEEPYRAASEIDPKAAHFRDNPSLTLK